MHTQSKIYNIIVLRKQTFVAQDGIRSSEAFILMIFVLFTCLCAFIFLG